MAGVRELKPAFYAAVVGQIYEAALDPRRWHDVLDTIETAYRDARITMFAHRNGRPSSSFAFRKNFPDDDLRVYSEHFVKVSPFIANIHRGQIGIPQYSEVLIGDDDLAKTEYFNDFMRTRRLGHYATGIVFEHNSCGMTALAIADHKDDSARRAQQMHLLGIILPHLQRAIRLHRTIDTESAARSATQALFDRWTQAAFVLDASGRMLSMNAAAERLLARESCIWLDRNGILHGLDRGGKGFDMLISAHAGIADKLAAAPRPAASDVLLLPRPAPAPPLHAMASPLPSIDSRAQLGGPRGRVLLIVSDPLETPRTSIGWLAHRFGLSPGEAKLTEAIVNGMPLADAAQQLGIQLSTARTRLKIIQGKTGCSRQLDLVRLALSMPALGQD
jgi:DNA-binding CsgD family transcriptional regulator